MLCIRPYVVRGVEFGCYKCKACRVNRKKMWTGRLMLELTQHEMATFATLTYKNAPDELVPEDMRLFLGRLRYYAPRPFRYFGVGEYGGLNGRPHFHLALFGIGIHEYQYIEQAWSVGGESLGGIHVGELNEHSAAYILKYTLKGWQELKKHEGKHPEFSRMSRNPGIGCGAVKGIAGNLLYAHGGSIQPEDIGDVPSQMRSGGYKYPLGKLLRGKLREEIGWEARAPAAVVEALSLEANGRTKAEKDLRERKRNVAYDNLSARLKIHRSKEKL